MSISVGRRTALACSVGGMALAVGLAASAADAYPATTLDELVVTANKREERLKDVAVAVSAVTEARLVELQASSFQDYAKLVPGLSLSETKPGQTVLALRGLSSFSGGATVGVYVDDTPYGSSSGLTNAQFFSGDLNTYDVRRVEVLKGPQGTLYGASTLGGLLKFVTNPPDPSHFAADIEGVAQSIDGDMGWTAKGMVNLPVNDQVAVRITGLHAEAPGYIDDPARRLKNTNDGETSALRASILFKPTEGLSVRLSAVGQDSDVRGSNAIDAQVDATSHVLIPIRPLTGDLQLSHSRSEYAHTRYRIYDGAANWDLGWGAFTSITSYGTLRQTQLVDDSVLGSVVNFSGVDMAKFTQEVRLASPQNAHLEWIVGAYYTRETARLASNFTGVYTGLGDLAGNGSDINSTYKESAAFGTLTYHFTPTFDVALGGRYAHNDQTTDSFGTGSLLGAPHQLGESSEDVFLYSLAPRWRPNDLTIVYGRLASGYRPGGPNLIPFGVTGANKTFKSDTVTSGEIGVRSEFLDRRLSVDLSAFDIRWDDIQLIGNVAVNGVTVGLTQNGGTAESRGIEWTAVLKPVARLILTFNGAYTDAQLTADTTPEVGGKDGERLPFIPKWASALDVSYTWSAFGNTQAFVGGLVAFVGDRTTDFAPVGSPFPQAKLESYTTLDLRAGLQEGRWTAELFAKNLTDERGVTGLGTNESAAALSLPGGGGRTAVIIQPLTVGVSVGAHF